MRNNDNGVPDSVASGVPSCVVSSDICSAVALK
jgi:hypothetical protein